MRCWLDCKFVQPLWKTRWRFPQNLKIKLPYDPAVSQQNVLKKLGNSLWNYRTNLETCATVYVKACFLNDQIFFFWSSQVSSRFYIVLYFCHIRSKLSLLLLFWLRSGKILDTKPPESRSTHGWISNSVCGRFYSACCIARFGNLRVSTEKVNCVYDWKWKYSSIFNYLKGYIQFFKVHNSICCLY